MDTWGDLVRRQAGIASTSTDSRAGIGAIVIKPIVEQISEPQDQVRAIGEMLADAELGGRRATGWMRRHATNAKITSSPHGAPQWSGRTCCYAHLTAFEGRPDLRLPFETTCPTCGAVYRIRMSAIRR